ncbi:DUF4344 domain-containing metallopeptidase [Jannaschia sp. W003]|uniref:DUF4344 domain-containing metallopeptidase n=1 Tax=Jannaschia sp. W003 TaxID=2867012 RepID=UPI0021A42F35|nr:DUF4344 domain-containing metallopeptidase [Jannaschia sp. W003]UWQ21684.1 DUF4344 domain-containing metallopeptidase [Jannaschia sp. W003]
MIRALLLAFFATAAAAPARADFVLNNLRFTLYHEAAHAVIDGWSVGLSGPEEVAADGFAVLLAHRLHDEETSRDLITDAVRLGRMDAAEELFDPWEQYMPGAQRVAWTLCLWYGLAPARRGDHARALGMPASLAPRCEEAAGRLRAAWDPVLERMRGAGGRTSFRASRSGKALRLLAPDLLRLNREIALPRPIPVRSEACGEDNAFYYHFDARIVFCDEMVGALRAAAP